MATLRNIKRRQNAVKSTAKITQAMKMVSAAKLKRAQRAIESARPYVLKLEDMLSNLVASVGDDYSHPLTEKHKEIKTVAVIVIASDRGLCGSFNNNLFRTAVRHIEDEILNENPNINIRLIPVGKRTCSFFRKSQFEVIKEFPGIFSD